MYPINIGIISSNHNAANLIVQQNESTCPVTSTKKSVYCYISPQYIMFFSVHEFLGIDGSISTTIGLWMQLCLKIQCKKIRASATPCHPNKLRQSPMANLRALDASLGNGRSCRKTTVSCKDSFNTTVPIYGSKSMDQNYITVIHFALVWWCLIED